jgi:hypothetical protein
MMPFLGVKSFEANFSGTLSGHIERNLKFLTNGRTAVREGELELLDFVQKITRKTIVFWLWIPFIVYFKIG